MARRLPKRWRLYSAVLAVIVVSLVAWTIHDARQPGDWQHVFATREGLVGHRTSSMLVIKPDSMFVALPHRSALGKSVEVRYGDRTVVVPVLDVGPWNIDDAYWEAGDRPASERAEGRYRTPVNIAGIDLSDAVYAALGLHDNDYVDWRFVHRDYVALPKL